MSSFDWYEVNTDEPVCGFRKGDRLNARLVQTLGSDEWKGHSLNVIQSYLWTQKSNGLLVVTKSPEEDMQGSQPNSGFAAPSAIKMATEERERLQVVGELHSDEEKVHQYLDLGLHNDVWYYGRKLKGTDSIITSDRRMLVNRRLKRKQAPELDEIKSFMDYDNTLNDFAPMMSKEAAIRWIEGKEIITPAKVYMAIREKILHYMDFNGADEIAGVLALWTMGTYHYSLFYWYPNLLFNCPSSSGKTKASDIVLLLAFKGYDLGASGGATPAQIFRTIEMCRGTIRLDEYEQLDLDSKKLCDQLLNAGVKRDSYVIRNEVIKGKQVPTKFHIYCPKIACNISGINATSLNRFIPFRWLKSKSNKANRQPTSRQDIETFKPLRDDLYIYGLTHWRDVSELYEQVDQGELTGRAFDNIKPLRAIAQLIKREGCEEAEKDLERYLRTAEEVDVDTGDCTEEFFHALLDVVGETEEVYLSKTIGEWEGVKELLSFTKSPAHWIGRKMTEYRFTKVRHNRGNGYILSKKLVEDRLMLYFKGNNSTNSITPQSPQSPQFCGISGGCGLYPKGNKNDISYMEWPKWRDDHIHNAKCSDCGVSICNEAPDGKLYCYDCGKWASKPIEEWVR